MKSAIEECGQVDVKWLCELWEEHVESMALTDMLYGFTQFSKGLDNKAWDEVSFLNSIAFERHLNKELKS